MIKFRNVINNNKTTTLETRLKVFQAWGPCNPQKLFTLYHLGLKLGLRVRISSPNALALGVRISTPTALAFGVRISTQTALALGVRISTLTALIFLETRQHSVKAIIRKRQLNFWLNLNKDFGTEMRSRIDHASNLKYITHKNLELNYQTPMQVFGKINKDFYDDIWANVREATDQQSKLNLYHKIYNNCEHIPTNSLSLKHSTLSQQVVTRYTSSSHNLETEIGKWKRIQRNQSFCKQCNDQKEESLIHFISECERFKNFREEYRDFPYDKNSHSFFQWEMGALVLNKLHQQRK